MSSVQRSTLFLFIASLCLILLTSLPMLAQGAAPSATQTAPASPEIHAVLEKIVHPKKAAVGDKIIAHTTDAVKLRDGVDLPKGTHLVGKVTEIKMKADKEGPSKLGLLFTTAQLKDGKEIPVMMALVSVAPRWEPGGVDAVAADNKGSSIGKIAQMSGANPQTDAGAGGATLNKGLGIRGAGGPSAPDAMQPGVSYLPDVTIASYSMAEPGTVLQSTKTTVYVDSGSRLLLLAQ